MIRINLVADTDDVELGKDFRAGIETMAEFPERPTQGDIIYLEEFIDMSDYTDRERNFLEQNTFEVGRSAWSEDHDGVYLIVWCNPV